jgi:lysophospholipase L1-like esterase
MNRSMQRRGGALLVAQWPLLVGMQGRYPFAEPAAAIARACEEAGIRRVDLLEALRGRPDASLWVSSSDRHPNELAHRLAAEALAPVVRELAAGR